MIIIIIIIIIRTIDFYTKQTYKNNKQYQWYSSIL